VLGAGVLDPDAADEATLALREVTRLVREDERLAPTLLPLGEGLLAAIRV
jgi:predicted O-methyltransferase YrrM